MKNYKDDEFFKMLKTVFGWVLEKQEKGDQKWILNTILDTGSSLPPELATKCGIKPEDNKQGPVKVGYTIMPTKNDDFKITEVKILLKSIKESEFLQDHPSIHELFKTSKGRDELRVFLASGGTEFPQGLDGDMWPGLQKLVDSF